MKFAVVKTTVVTTKELHELEIAEYLDPLAYICPSTLVSTRVEREEKSDIFRQEELPSEDKKED